MPNDLNLLVLLCFLAVVASTTDQSGKLEIPQSVPLTAEQTDKKCSRYSALLSNIDADLSRWKGDGIPLRLMQQMIDRHTPRKGSRPAQGDSGFAAGFWKGKAYLLDVPDINRTGHHATLMFVYLRMLLHLERVFAMPDVDFVINTIDRPLGLNLPPSSSDEPVFRFCKGDSHADILIPNFHFHMKKYDDDLLSHVLENNNTYPCKHPKPWPIIFTCHSSTCFLVPLALWPSLLHMQGRARRMSPLAASVCTAVTSTPWTPQCRPGSA